MKVISLWQPWAILMAMGLKTIETRSWGTKYRGSLAIHAALKVVPFIDTQLKMEIETLLGLKVVDLPRGGIIATVNLTNCVRITDRSQLPEEPEICFGDYARGRYMWFTDKHLALKKIVPCRGRQGLFNVPDEALRVCRMCGCSDYNACEGGCYWVEKDLCSACVGGGI